jgi:hypothetical protein
LAGLIELKLGAGRLKDSADIIELIKSNLGEVPSILRYLGDLHPDYAQRFMALVAEAAAEG